jgi:hypothetical protein
MSKAIDFQLLQYKKFPFSTADSTAAGVNDAEADEGNSVSDIQSSIKVGRWLELISAVLSFGCLVVLLWQWGTGGPATVRLTQEVLLYTNEI